MIKMNDVHKSFGKLEVLKGINLHIEKGEVVVIIGPSGSGKSTVLRCMNYLEQPTSGEVIVDGMNLNDKANINNVRAEVGMVFQRFNLFPHMSVLDNITLAPQKIRKLSKADAEKIAHELLAKVGLSEKANAYPEQLSGGQQQRVAIARALIAKPDVIFADEPTGNLDSKSGGEVMELLQNVWKKMGKALVVITHDSRIARMADRQFQIVDGVLAEVTAK